MFYVSQQNHINHRAMKASARTKYLKQYRTPVAYNLASHVTSMWYVLRVIIQMENALEIVVKCLTTQRMIHGHKNGCIWLCLNFDHVQNSEATCRDQNIACNKWDTSCIVQNSS